MILLMVLTGGITTIGRVDSSQLIKSKPNRTSLKVSIIKASSTHTCRYVSSSSGGHNVPRVGSEPSNLLLHEEERPLDV
jgi:hypothetical protein